MPNVLLVISADLPSRPQPAADTGNAGTAGHAAQASRPAPEPATPRKDYTALSEVLDAATLDRTAVRRSPVGRFLARTLGVAVAQAWLAFRQRHQYEAIVTDGEHIGIPLALLLKLARAKTPHITIGHRITAVKKRPFFRWLKVHTHMARIVLHSRLQYEIAERQLGIPASHLALLPYQVDVRFWRPQPVPEERLISSAGLEFRDYPTLFKAAEGLDAKVVIGAASYWSKRRNTAATQPLPPNVEVGAFDYAALRDLYARSAVVVVPLQDVDFQAGVTCILEAMAMAKPVVVTHSLGQTDVVQDRRTITRGASPRPQPANAPRFAVEAAVEPNGYYVLPGDAAGLRNALAHLLEHPEERTKLGAAGRRLVEHLMSVDHFAARFRDLVQEAISQARGVPERRAGEAPPEADDSRAPMAADATPLAAR